MDLSNSEPSGSKVLLWSPKYINNLAAAVRACACWGADELLFTGSRIEHPEEARLPRELRMKAYADVVLTQTARPFDLTHGYTPVCVELLNGAVPLTTFVHPPKAVYVFGPEDGSVPQVWRRLCHHFVYLPSAHCLNLAATINVVLYDRAMKGGK